MSKKQDAAALEAVRDYLQKQNRPYSTVDIFTNMHKEHGKTAVQKAIDQLVANGKVCEKTYGKQKVYVVNQSEFSNVNDAEIKEMDSKIAELNEQLSSGQTELRAVESELTKLTSSLTTQDAEKLLQQTSQEVEHLRQKLKSLAENPSQVTREDKEKVSKERDRHVKEWRKRKRISDEILNSILEGYPKGKKALYEEVGIETDSDVGVSFPQ